MNNQDIRMWRDLIADRDEWRQQHENALAAWQADMRALKAKQDAGLSALATRLNLFLPADFDPYYAIGLDIARLQDTERLWSQACQIARAHCPVSTGQSHVRDGIPALAKRAQAAEYRAEAYKAQLVKLVRELREWSAKAERTGGADVNDIDCLAREYEVKP